MQFCKNDGSGKGFYADCHWTPVEWFWKDWCNVIYILNIFLWMSCGVIGFKGM